MSMHKLGLTATNLRKINQLIFCHHCVLQKRFVQNRPTDDSPDDKPIVFSKSEASKWKAEFSRSPPYERAWFTPHVVSLSTFIFLLYFCVLREENDLDEIIYRPLPETIVGIDKAYPEFNFYEKPEFVQYHENKAKSKNTGKAQSETKKNQD